MRQYTGKIASAMLHALSTHLHSHTSPIWTTIHLLDTFNMLILFTISMCNTLNWFIQIFFFLFWCGLLFYCCSIGFALKRSREKIVDSFDRQTLLCQRPLPLIFFFRVFIVLSELWRSLWTIFFFCFKFCEPVVYDSMQQQRKKLFTIQNQW